MADSSYLDWPFFEDRHRELARSLDAWAALNIAHSHTQTHRADVDAECRALVKQLGAAGWLKHAVGSHDAAIDTRGICIIRETLARYSGLADFAFAMQGLGSGAISLAGSAAQQERVLPLVARGQEGDERKPRCNR